MTRIDPTKLEAAKEWAKRIHSAHHPDSAAAAEVIAALPDEWIDAEKLAGQAAQLRALYNAIEHTSVDKVNDLSFRALVSTIGAHVEMLEALLPVPAPRTMADMTPAEQDACIGMAAAVDGFRIWYIVGRDPDTYGQWITCTKGGRVQSRIPKVIVPLPDLPPLVWPDEHHPATDTEETPEPAQPRPGDVPAGERAMEEQTNEVVRGFVCHDDVERIHLPDGTAVHRFVTDWEEQA